MARGVSLKSLDDFPNRIKIFFFLIITIFLIGIFGFMFSSNIGFEEAFIRTLQTLAFIFAEEATLIERLLEIFLALIGVFCVWWVLWSFADMVLEGNLTNYFKNRFYLLNIMKMKEHIILVGGGRTGGEVAKHLAQKKVKFVVIDNDLVVVEELKKKGYFVVFGDAEKEITLEEANIKKAKKMIITTPKNHVNLFITLTAKELNGEIKILSRAEKQSVISKLKRAGADLVIVPEVLAGKKIIEDIFADEKVV